MLGFRFASSQPTTTDNIMIRAEPENFPMNRRNPLLSARIHIVGLAALLVSVLSGCGALSSLTEGDDNRVLPTELEPIEHSLPVRRLWSAEVGGSDEEQPFDLRPAFLEGRIYVAGSEGVVTALDAATGRRVWRVELQARIVGGVGVGEGLVVVSTERGDVLALHPDDGREVWRTPVGSLALAPVALAEGYAVVRTGDGKVRGLSAADGVEVWVQERRLPALTLRGVGAPVIQAGKVIAGMDNGRVIVVDLARGHPVWERTIASPSGRSELERMVDIDADPRPYQDKLYVAAFQGRLMEINFEDGSVNWARSFSSHTGMDVGPLRLLITDEEGELWVFERISGEPLLKQSALRGRGPTAPRRLGSHVVVGDFEGYVHWFSLETGETAARVRVDDAGIGVAPLVVGDVVFVLSKGGVLSALQGG